MESGCGPCDPSCGTVTILQGYAKTYHVELFYEDTQISYDLTGATEIIAVHPAAAAGPPVEEKYTTGRVTIIGSPGTGLIQVLISADDSALLQLNPNGNQRQDLQVSVTNADGSVTGFLLPAVLNIFLPTYGVV